MDFQIITYAELGKNNVFCNAVCRITRMSEQCCIHLGSRIEFITKKFEYGFLSIEWDIAERAIDRIIQCIDESWRCMAPFDTDDLGF